MAEPKAQNNKHNQEPGRPVTLVKKLTDSQFVREFKDFVNRGSVVELAIGVAVGGAFTSIAKSLVDDIIMPITSLLLGGLDFSRLAIDVPNIFGADTTAHIAYGNFLQNVVNFLIIAFVVFIIVRFLNQMNANAKKVEEDLKKEKERVKEKKK